MTAYTNIGRSLQKMFSAYSMDNQGGLNTSKIFLPHEMAQMIEKGCDMSKSGVSAYCDPTVNSSGKNNSVFV
jgi:hypothetical protein